MVSWSRDERRLTPKRGYRRGYPVAVLIGFEEDRAVLWRVFSNVVKPEKTLWLDGNRGDPKAAYNFHESIINALRPAFKEGVRSTILASPPRTNHAQEFIMHVREHHAWLVQGPNKVTFSVTAGSAGTLSEVAALTRASQFRRQVKETTSEETEHLVNTLEKRLNTQSENNVVLYSLKETEDLIFNAWKPGKPKPEQLMVTDKYLSESREKNRIHRLLQIASNKNVRTRIVDAESVAGKRLTQLGGLVCFAQLK
jgi:stalled ribosome rescue protein Dom34